MFVWCGVVRCGMLCMCGNGRGWIVILCGEFHWSCFVREEGRGREGKGIMGLVWRIDFVGVPKLCVGQRSEVVGFGDCFFSEGRWIFRVFKIEYHCFCVRGFVLIICDMVQTMIIWI